MNMVIPNEGKLLFAAWAFKSTSITEAWQLSLFSNNFTVVDATVLADFTKATFTGFTDLIITRGDMGTPSIVSNVAVSTLGTVPTWTCTGGSPQTVYGWYLYLVTTGKCLAAQNFDVPRVMSTGTIEKLDPFAIKLKTFA